MEYLDINGSIRLFTNVISRFLNRNCKLFCRSENMAESHCKMEIICRSGHCANGKYHAQHKGKRENLFHSFTPSNRIFRQHFSMPSDGVILPFQSANVNETLSQFNNIFWKNCINKRCFSCEHILFFVNSVMLVFFLQV